MTQKKLEIIGPYTPEHDGPFCTRSGQPVDLRISNGRGWYPLIGYIGDSVSAFCWRADGLAPDGRPNDLMNAREVPVAREFWINECCCGDGSTGFSCPHETECEAARERHELPSWNWVRTIHVREVLPGDEQ